MARQAVEHLPLVLDQLEKYRKDGKTLNLDGKSLELSDIARLTTSRFEKLEIFRRDPSNSDRKLCLFATKDNFRSRGLRCEHGIRRKCGCAIDGRCRVAAGPHPPPERWIRGEDGRGSGTGRDGRASQQSEVRGYSGVRPEVVDLLCAMVNADIVPVVPLRGTVSASGDLLPLSYVAACMSGREDARVLHRGQATTVSHAFKEENLSFIEFQAKEALAVINASVMRGIPGWQGPVRHGHRLAADPDRHRHVSGVHAWQDRVLPSNCPRLSVPLWKSRSGGQPPVTFGRVQVGAARPGIEPSGRRGVVETGPLWAENGRPSGSVRPSRFFESRPGELGSN